MQIVPQRYTEEEPEENLPLAVERAEKGGVMTDNQRKAIYEALLGDVSYFAPGDIARRTLEEVALVELEAIEPVIDSLIAEARAQGRAAS